MLIHKQEIFYRKWPAKKVKAVILAVHGMGANAERWTAMAMFMKTKSISTYAIALRGFGELSGDSPGHVPSMELYADDIAALKGIIQKENPDKPVFLIGESMGGVIIHSVVLDHDAGYSGLIEVVPVYRDVMKLSLLQRVGIVCAGIFKPSGTVKMPFITEELTRDSDMVKKLRADRREHRYASRGLLIGMTLRQMRALSKPAGIKIPLLFLLAGKDALNDTKFAMRFFSRLKGDKECKIYPDSYHALTIEKNRNEVFRDIFGWIGKHLKQPGNFEKT
ncbi:MAG: alpha/beta hydrolase [Spirochaetia bacterium]|nr:alpha/beta hydrolase [Spirochaetia bacterium]